MWRRGLRWPGCVCVMRAAGLHYRRHVAVDVDCSASDVAREVGGQEAGQVRELLGRADAPERDIPSHLREKGLVRLVSTLLGVTPDPLVAVNQPDMERVDENVV